METSYWYVTHTEGIGYVIVRKLDLADGRTAFERYEREYKNKAEAEWMADLMNKLVKCGLMKSC